MELTIGHEVIQIEGLDNEHLEHLEVSISETKVIFSSILNMVINNKITEMRQAIARSDFHCASATEGYIEALTDVNIFVTNGLSQSLKDSK